MFASVIALASLVQGPTPLARAESLLVAGDTAAAIAVLTGVPQDSLLPGDGVSAFYALSWIGRSYPWPEASRAVADRAEALFAWARRVDAGEPLDTAGEVHDVKTGAMRWASAEADLDRLAARLRLPEIPTCATRETPWTEAKGVLSGCALPQTVARVVDGDPRMAASLIHARRMLVQLLEDPWPFNELGMRSLVAVELLFGTPPTRAALAGYLPRLDLDERIKTPLAAMLFAFEGKPDSAWALMEERRALFAPLDTLLGPLGSRAQLAPGMVWRMGWPLFLDPYNERLVAHRARVLAADLVFRFTANPVIQALVPREDLIRAGLPTRIGRAGAGLVRFWDAHTVETLLPASEQVPGGLVDLDLAVVASAPVSGQAFFSGFVPARVDRIVDLRHQGMRYERDGKVLLDLFAQTPPLGHMECQYETGFFWLDREFHLLRRVVDTVPKGQVASRHYTAELKEGSYFFSLEAKDVTCRVAARARLAVAAKPASTGLAMSDVLLADGLVPVEPIRVRGGIPVTGRPGLDVSVSEPVSLYWEVYGLTAAAGQGDSLLIEVDAQDVRRGKIPIVRLGELQRAADQKASDAAVHYALAVPPGDGPVGLGLSVRIPMTPDAVFRLRVVVTDQMSGAKASGTRTIYVRRPERH